jgi:hypothetical protein
MKTEINAGLLADQLGRAVAAAKVANDAVESAKALLIEAAGDYVGAPKLIQGTEYAWRVSAGKRSSCPQADLLTAIADRFEICVSLLQECVVSATKTVDGIPNVRAAKLVQE